ncbi:unnamed protein product [Moneuplotes crassus]|uniref:Uncharacterized protein n=1 Tax=Euplotes crassus TaxID=5936 RepID=A0AAD1Y0J5_EUPCR|nr:unnamed protein product [Moneuplotes crassus]
MEKPSNDNLRRLSMYFSGKSLIQPLVKVTPELKKIEEKHQKKLRMLQKKPSTRSPHGCDFLSPKKLPKSPFKKEKDEPEKILSQQFELDETFAHKEPSEFLIFETSQKNKSVAVNGDISGIRRPKPLLNKLNLSVVTNKSVKRSSKISLSVNATPARIHTGKMGRSFIKRQQKDDTADNISGVMYYLPEKGGGFKCENALNLIPLNMQPNNNTSENEDFLICKEKAEKLLKSLQDRNPDQRIKELSVQVFGMNRIPENSRKAAYLGTESFNEKRDSHDPHGHVYSKEVLKAYKKLQDFDIGAPIPALASKTGPQKATYDLETVAKNHCRAVWQCRRITRAMNRKQRKRNQNQSVAVSELSEMSFNNNSSVDKLIDEEVEKLKVKYKMKRRGGSALYGGERQKAARPLRGSYRMSGGGLRQSRENQSGRFNKDFEHDIMLDASEFDKNSQTFVKVRRPNKGSLLEKCQKIIQMSKHEHSSKPQNLNIKSCTSSVEYFIKQYDKLHQNISNAIKKGAYARRRIYES